MTYNIAGVDIHKSVLIVVVSDAAAEAMEFVCRRFGATASERQHLVAWLQEQGVQEVVIAYASHCTSLGRCDTFSTCKSLFDNLTPLALCGGLGPGSS